MSREKPEGIAHRELLRRVIVPHLRPGMRVPSAKRLAELLGINQAEAARHMNRVLTEDGFKVQTRAPRGFKGIFVIIAPKCIELSPISPLSCDSTGSQRVVTPVYEGSDTRIEVGQ